MQRRRGTNHADWYFFTCLTSNRVGADHCTGMYVREEDIFSAIYYQLKLYLESHFITNHDYEIESAALKQKIADYREILADPNERAMYYYEQLVMKEISPSEYQNCRQNICEANERMNASIQALEQYEQRYQQFSKMLKVCDQKIPLIELIDLIEKITINEKRMIQVTWNASMKTIQNKVILDFN